MLNKMKEVEKHIQQVKKKGLPIIRVNLAEVLNMPISSYAQKYLDENTNEYIKKVAEEQKEEILLKSLKGYVKQLVKEKKSITYANIAELHGVSGSRAKILFQKAIFKDYINSVKTDNKILSANDSFKEFYFKHEPFDEFKTMKASDIFKKYAKDYFDTVQNFSKFCTHYNVPFLRVNKSKNSQ